jgi:hypothetical protein
MNDQDVPNLRTAGVIAVEVGEPLHRVLYILRTRRHIRPVARAGRLRLYDSTALSQVRDAIQSMARPTESCASTRGCRP